MAASPVRRLVFVRVSIYVVQPPWLPNRSSLVPHSSTEGLVLRRILKKSGSKKVAFFETFRGTSEEVFQELEFTAHA